MNPVSKSGLTKSTVAADLPARKRKFRSALALRQMTAAEFAAMHGVTAQMVSQVLSGHSSSARISKAINLFISAVLGDEVAA